MKPRPPHSVRAHVAITRELVRVTLGGLPGRPELLDWIPDDRTQRRKRRRR